MAIKGIVDPGVRRLSWRERRVREWLSTLPSAEPVKAMGLLAQSVRALNGSVIDPATHTALLACYEEPVMNLAAILQNRHSEGNGAALATTLHSEIAHGYQAALTPGLPTVWREVAILGALCQLAEVIRSAYRAYVPAPPGVWRRIHSLFREAGPRPDEAIEQAYSAVLLLGLSDPYALPTGGIDAVYEIILEVGHRAVLNDTVGFAIASDEDRPADPTGTEGTLFLDTDDLVAEIVRMRAALTARKILPSRLAATMLPALADRLLISLGETWRPGPRRKSLRIRLSGERLVCHGLAALRRLAAEDREGYYIDLDGDWRSATPQILGSEGPKAAPRVTSWHVRDAGRTGLWLSTHQLVGAPPAPGTWIGVKDPQRNQAWRAATVRWLRRSRPHEYAVGVELLGEAQTAVLLRRSSSAVDPRIKAQDARFAGTPGRSRTGVAREAGIVPLRGALRPTAQVAVGPSRPPGVRPSRA